MLTAQLRHWRAPSLVLNGRLISFTNLQLPDSVPHPERSRNVSGPTHNEALLAASPIIATAAKVVSNREEVRWGLFASASLRRSPVFGAPAHSPSRAPSIKRSAAIRSRTPPRKRRPPRRTASRSPSPSSHIPPAT